MQKRLRRFNGGGFGCGLKIWLKRNQPREKGADVCEKRRAFSEI